jgi:hypothetical protein
MHLDLHRRYPPRRHLFCRPRHCGTRFHHLLQGATGGDDCHSFAYGHEDTNHGLDSDGSGDAFPDGDVDLQCEADPHNCSRDTHTASLNAVAYSCIIANCNQDAFPNGAPDSRSFDDIQ